MQLLTSNLWAHPDGQPSDPLFHAPPVCVVDQMRQRLMPAKIPEPLPFLAIEFGSNADRLSICSGGKPTQPQ